MPPAPPPAKGGLIGFFKPPGGPVKVAQRIGIVIVVIALLATVVVAGLAAIRGKNPSTVGVTATETPSVAATSPSPTPGTALFTVQDPTNQFSISRPQNWTARALTVPDKNIAMIIGPDAPYPQSDLVAVTFHQLPFPLANRDVLQFKDFILELIGTDANILSQSPSPTIDGHAGYSFTWTYPKAAPTTLHEAYYIIDGDRFVTILLQIEPPQDTNALSSLTPIFQNMAQTFKSFHITPTPTSTVTAPTSTSTPTPTVSATH